MVDKGSKKPFLTLVKQDQDIEDQMQKLTLEQEGKTYKEEKKEDILQIIATNQESKSFDFQDFKFIQHLGSGASGAVDLVVHEKTNKKYAKKKIQFQDNQTIQKHLTWEVKTLFTSQSPQIVKYYGAYYKDQNIHIVQEFMDKGSLDAVLKKVGKFSDVILGEMTLQILEGLNYLHKTLKIIHRDIKPANILLNSEGQVKIADLGICGKIDNTVDQRQTWVGTIGYMSPERLKGEPYSNNTDIWSLGLMLLECKIGRNPLSKNNENQPIWDVLRQLEEFEFPELPEDTSKKFTKFMKCCLEKDPKKRQTAEQLLQHEFIQKFTQKRELAKEGFKQWLQTVV